VQTVCVAEETPELLELASRHPVIRGVVGWVDLTAPDVDDRIARLRSGPGGGVLVGIRHQVQEEPDPRWLLRPDVERGLQYVADQDLVFDLLVKPHQLPAAVEVCRRLPQLRFVLDHAGKPDIAAGRLDPWRGELSKLARLPNVAAKLSGLLTEARADWTVDQLRPFAAHVLDAFGPRRVLFGSDWPVSTLRADYATVVSVTEQLVAQLSESERAAVFGETASTVYSLRPTPETGDV
jgi:L-fuconolactonase